MKNFKLLLLGTSLSCFPQLAYTQCVVTEDCAALGYTETSCPGNGVKCPFGNGWFCGGDEASICAENGFKYSCTGTGYAGGAGFACGGKYTQCNCTTNYVWNGSSCALSCSSSYKYTCTGTGYAGGAGSACDGKYTQCACASGYEWKNGSCQKQILNGAQGDLYYCNGKVVGIKAPNMNFYVGMEDLGYITLNEANDSCKFYSFCGNLKGILPSKDQLLMMYNNKLSLEALLISNGGNKFLTSDDYWSSTYYIRSANYYYYVVNMSDGKVRESNITSGYDLCYVRPILVNY